MILYRQSLVVLSLILLNTTNSAFAGVASVYTDVACKTSQPVSQKISKNPGKQRANKRPPASSTVVCPSVAGFRLQVKQQQGRSTVNIIAPDRRIFPLNYWDVVSVGGRAEWRVVSNEGRTVPIGLIVPVKSVAAGDQAAQPVLAVAKIGKHTACVVKKIDVYAPRAQEDARQHADGQAEICMQRPAVELPK